MQFLEGRGGGGGGGGGHFPQMRHPGSAIAGYSSTFCQNFSLISLSIPEIWPIYSPVHYKLTFMVMY